MLLKAGILKLGGKIRDKESHETIGFKRALRISLSNLCFVTQEQGLVLQTINGLRDAAQHHYVTLSEGQLYLHAQSGVTLFRDLLYSIFTEELKASLPERMLPISTSPVTNSINLFERETNEVRKLLAPGKRQTMDAYARLRGIAIVDNALLGSFTQPTDRDLANLGRRLANGEVSETVFPGITGVTFSSHGEGSRIDLRLTKNDGIAIHYSSADDETNPVLAIKSVNEMDYFNLTHGKLASKVGLTGPKTTAAVALLGLKGDAKSSREFVFGKTKHAMYSQHAIERIRELLTIKTVEDIWGEYRRTKRT
jgi:hypothetical protein